jgi:uncharacterized repeat protein (TIGR02543 family)
MAGKRRQKLPVEVSYKLIGKNRYSFVVAKADPNLPIVIDPILQSTYLGGSGSDEATALAISSTGDVYVAGITLSTYFPNTSGGAQAAYGGGGYTDVFVTRLNSNLTQILQSTYLGGTGDDYAYALAISSTGDVYVAGETGSTNFPNTTGGAQATYGGGLSDAFVTRLNSNLTQIIQSTYLGGRDIDDATALAISSTGDVYVTGLTDSINFPNTTGGAQTSIGGNFDIFVTRLNSNLTQIIQSTYLGGTGDEYTYALTISSTGDVYVAGYTDSRIFPGTTGGAQATFGGYTDAFVTRLNSNLTQIIQSTYLGVSNNNYAYALAISSTGDVYVVGETTSNSFPKTTGGAQATYGGGLSDAFVTRLNSNLTQILQSTYLGGSGKDYASILAISSTGDVYVAGITSSIDFPKTSGGVQENYGGGDYDAFVARLTADLAATASSYTLSINPIPTNGKVTSSPAGINCGSGGSACSATFTSASTISLTAIPNTGYIFVGWTDDCSSCGTSTTCTINMTANKTCSANFTASNSSGDSGSGSGSGSSGGSGSGSGTGSDSGSGSGGGSGSGTGSGSGSSGGSGSGTGGGGGGCSMTGPASMAGWWNIFTWLLIPTYVLARRIRRMK